ncbi:hypothetical protein Q669_15895 [Labrenzia sp. C1B10]|uniref:hypothetical protein n=1 Tax=unclassified Labrenzia TaxID=2648686 RepID=UPI0003B87EA2|nr:MULTISPECIES: hypothetical protein [unclassified Labrenzia]ERP85894.1 hypothetical protein Q669_15895 [Labrenzia sp. C1B10]ERS06193.1 hypothetical protein Q675_28560 [Labrenzia sp. C1B70]
MNSFCKTLLAAAGMSMALGVAAQAESGTTRIVHDEPYGAIVTKEAGVLVFRGLPPTRKVIVNPDGKTPLELKQTEVTETNVMVFADQSDYVRALGPKIIRLK